MAVKPKQLQIKRWSGEQVELAQRRQLGAFKSSIPSLQVAASFACSVASLSRSPAFQLPGHHHLHGEVLADHQFDWGGLSTCTAAHVQCLLTPSPSQNLQESPPSNKLGARVPLACTGHAVIASLPLARLAFRLCCATAAVHVPPQRSRPFDVHC